MSLLAHHPRAAEVAGQVLAGQTPPEHVLAAISDILDIRPHDTLFKIIPQPGTGFGRVECHEKECHEKNKIITLNDQSGLPDGGKFIGIGSLDHFIHHQKESPAHQRAYKARRSANRAIIASKSNETKKRTLIEVSDGEDDVIILPAKKKIAPPASHAIPTAAASSTLSTTLPINTFPLTRLDKGKGRAVPENASAFPVGIANKAGSPINFTSNTAIPHTLQADMQKPRRLSDDDADSDTEMAARSDRSSADSDLVDLADKFTSKTAAKQQNQALAPVVPRTRKISDENIKPVITSAKYDSTTAYGRFKALQDTSATAGKKPARQEDVDMVPATFDPVSYYKTAMREVKPAVPSSSSPDGEKANRAGMDSGYLSSINTSSSPAAGRWPGSNIKPEVMRTNPQTPSSQSTSVPDVSSVTSSVAPISKDANADYLARINGLENSILANRRQMGILHKKMKSCGKRTTLHVNAKAQHAACERRVQLYQDKVRKLKLEATGLSSAVKPNATASTSASKPSARPAVASQPLPATAPAPAPKAPLSAMDITYARDLANYEAQYKVFSQKMEAMTKECNALAKSRDSMQNVVDRIPDPAVKKLYNATLESIAAKLVNAQKKLREHMRKTPVMPKKGKPAPSVPPPAPAPKYTQAAGSATNAALATMSQWDIDDLRNRLLRNYPGQFIDTLAGNDMNSYGDSDASLGYLVGRGPNPYNHNWSAPPVPGPSNPFPNAAAYAGAAAGPAGSAAYVGAAAGPAGSAAYAGAAAGPAGSAAYAGHSANLGPTHLPHAPVAPVKAAYDPMLESYDRRRDLDDFTGAGRVYTEAETLSFFKDAAAGYDFNEEGEAALDDAMVTIGITKQGDIFPDTTIQPYAHQILGIAWMINQEKVRTKIKGGILADDMGLGKTVQTISLIHLNQAKEGDDEKATLILAPNALLEQWKNEINVHTGGRMKAYIYHGSGKKISKDDLQKYDIVISTTQTMALEWEMCDDAARRTAKSNAKKKGHEWTKEDEDDWYEKASDQMKPLFTINWRRVVIDEAQNIRNRATRVSRAACYLNATYRWCLTGTPVTNTLTDIYSLLRFLKVDPWQDWAKWRDDVHRIEKKHPERASKKVQAILTLTLLRRHKESKLNGVRLLNLLPMHVHDEAVILSEDEKNVYEYMEGKSQQQISKYIREGTVMKNYAHVLVLLLRLRQCVGHPALVTESFLNSAYSKAEDAIADRTAAHARVSTMYGQANLDGMLKRRIDLAKQRFEDEKAQRDIQMEECPICMDPLDASALITACGHAFCSCIKQWIEQPETAAQNPENFGEEDRPCPNCRQKITKETLFPLQHFEPTKEQLAEITGTEVTDDQEEFEKEVSEYLKKKNIETIGKKGKKTREENARPARAAKRAAKRRIIKESDDEDNFIDDSEESNPVAGYTKETGAESDSEAEIDIPESDFDDDGTDVDSDDGDVKDFLRSKKEEKDTKVWELSKDVKDKFKHVEGREFIPSAKMEAMLRIIRESPKDDRIMIVSQWTSMLDLVAAYLDEQRIRFISFRGDMSRSERDAAVKRFNGPDRPVKCMLMSLKAGGVGLNMVGGNRAILLDLAWSPAVEAQVFCRLHRLGQKKEVFVERCIVAGTVEDRILTLQEHKKKLADFSLGEGSGEKLKKFGINEIKMLFGMGGEQGHFASSWVHPDHDKDSPKIKLPSLAGPSGSSSADGSAAAASAVRPVV